jgi:hypothetical protein
MVFFGGAFGEMGLEFFSFPQFGNEERFDLGMVGSGSISLDSFKALLDSEDLAVVSDNGDSLVHIHGVLDEGFD